MNKTEVLDSINWQEAMAAPRCAGGHRDVMDVLFKGKAAILASYVEDGYDGELAYAYWFPDGTVCVITDYFGSCSGCDSWEDASADDARRLITSMVTSSRLFPSHQALSKYIADGGPEEASEFSHRAAACLEIPADPISRLLRELAEA